MAQPVWVLSVDLQTKTGTFTTGMADAAKQARMSMGEIKTGGQEMGESVGHSMGEARHGVMLLGEEFGIHLPRGLTTFIASLGPVGAAMEAAFPFLAIAVGATLLLEHLAKLREEGEKLTEDQEKFATATNNAFNSLDQKMLQVGIRTDELNKNHMAALHKELQLIDLQSMDDPVKSFDTVAKAADVVMAGLKGHWYEQGIGAAGASSALTHFKAQYDLLLSEGKDKEASDLLAGTRQTAEKTLAMMKQLDETRADPAKGKQGDYAQYEVAAKYLRERGILTQIASSYTEKEYSAQVAIVDALDAQVTIQQKVADLKKAESANAVTGANKKEGADADKAWKEQAEAAKRFAEQEQRTWDENYRIALEHLQQSEKEKIEATEQGSLQRLAAINAAMTEENGYGLQETAFYRSLLSQRVEVTRQMTDEQAKLTAEAGKEEAEHSERMAEMALAAEREHWELMASVSRTAAQERAEMDIRAANEGYAIKMASFEQQIAALDKFGKDYDNKLKALQDRETELTQAHENQVTNIQEKAEADRIKRILDSENRFNDEIARGLSSAIMQHQSFAAMILGLGDQIADGMLENAIKSMLTDDMTKEKDAAYAARQAFKAGMHFPFPVNLVMAPVLGAAAFASVMAFETGTDMVPGVGRGDVVPAMLTPGEGVVPGGVMDKLRGLADSGGLDGGRKAAVHVHFMPTYHVSTIDGDGIRGVLKKHSQEFAQHVHSELRKLNR